MVILGIFVFYVVPYIFLTVHILCQYWIKQSEFDLYDILIRIVSEDDICFAGFCSFVRFIPFINIIISVFILLYYVTRPLFILMKGVKFKMKSEDDKLKLKKDETILKDKTFIIK